MGKLKRAMENSQSFTEAVSKKSKKKFKKIPKKKKSNGIVGVGNNVKEVSKSSSVVVVDKPVRYFNQPLNTKPKTDGEGGGGNEGEKKKFKKMKKHGKKRGSGGDSTPQPPSVSGPPKPKRLNKGPFKVKGKSNDNSFRERKNTFSGKKKERDDGGGGSKGEQKLEESKEMKERIKSFKNKSQQQEGGPQQKKLKMIVKPGGGKWYEESDDAPESKSTSNGDESTVDKIVDRKLSKDEIFGMRKTATGLFENDCSAYLEDCYKGEQKSDFRWMEKMMKVGTLPDKMAAYVVKIQDSPIHNLHHLQNLISMVKVQSKQQCIMAAETLKDLFLEDLLPPDRKLLSFDKRGSTLTQGSRSQMIKWMFEDRLKTCYKSFVDALRRMSADNVEKIRAKAVLIIYQLLTSHPEQEAELLQMIVNKLGDPMKKVGSRGLFYLNSLLHNHPRMKMVVIDEVERLLFRNNIAKRAQYYGICFLNSINLEDEHPEVACKLINVYIAFFKGCIKTGDIESKMMSALLTGVNKSYPSAKEYGFKFTENIDTLYKITYLSNFNVGLQALSILFQLMDVDSRPNDADRYYRVLYRELLRPELATTSHNLQFLNLIYRSMKCDKNVSRIMGFCKRLLQICQNVQPNLACAILYLISEVSKAHTGIINVGEVLPDPEDILVSDNDSEADELEEESRKKGMADLMKISNVKDDDGEVKKIRDDDADESDKVNMDNIITKEGSADANDDKDDVQQISIVDMNSSGIICDDDDDIKPEIKTEYKHKLTEFDPFARNPSYCGAEFSLFYEIQTLTDHYHPSVSLFANSLLRKKPIVYEGNPLKDFTTTRFLERFVYKNSKKPKMTPGAPRAYQPIGLRNIPVNSSNYLSTDEEKIPAEEKFFYRYFKDRKTQKSDADNDVSETESVDDDEFDDLMANYFKTAKGKGMDDEDEDLLDFAADIHMKPDGKKRKKTKEAEESEDDEEMSEQEGSDEEFGAADDADEMMDLDDDDDDDFEDEDGLEVFETDFDDPVKKNKRKLFGKDIDMFAPAEEFAEMLETNADGGLTGPNTLINRDNADPKQLKWEMDRDRWMKGYKRNPKTKFSNKHRKN